VAMQEAGHVMLAWAVRYHWQGRLALRGWAVGLGPRPALCQLAVPAVVALRRSEAAGVRLMHMSPMRS
jgi:hypothetical protein